MIMYMCIKFESNTLNLSYDMEREPFLLRTDGTRQSYVQTAVLLYGGA